jgi:hypothetical protein
METRKIPHMKKPNVEKALVRATKSVPAATRKPLIAKQPQSKQEAAVQAGMFLYTTDDWSMAYFNENDLHCMEREVFG